MSREQVSKNKEGITIHSAQDFQAMRKSGALAAACLDAVTDIIEEGVTTNQINQLCHDFIVRHHATPAPLHYKGYPKSVCTSVNYEVCHGIPNDHPLRRGDILNVDVTVIHEGWYGDSSRMFVVGDWRALPSQTQKLITITYDALMRAIDTVREGSYLGDIGSVIQSVVEAEGFSVVREFCGHGLGRVFHDAPQVVHFGKPGAGARLQEGMFFTIEPMINVGAPAVTILKDGWTAITRDRSLSAQFEHSIGVTSNGAEIFTASAKGWHKPPYTSS